jgi:hypothetical protein
MKNIHFFNHFEIYFPDEKTIFPKPAYGTGIKWGSDK